MSRRFSELRFQRTNQFSVVAFPFFFGVSMHFGAARSLNFTFGCEALH